MAATTGTWNSEHPIILFLKGASWGRLYFIRLESTSWLSSSVAAFVAHVTPKCIAQTKLAGLKVSRKDVRNIVFVVFGRRNHLSAY